MSTKPPLGPDSIRLDPSSPFSALMDGSRGRAGAGTGTGTAGGSRRKAGNSGRLTLQQRQSNRPPDAHPRGEDVTRAQGQPTQFVCPICSRHYSSQNDLTTHMSSCRDKLNQRGTAIKAFVKAKTELFFALQYAERAKAHGGSGARVPEFDQAVSAAKTQLRRARDLAVKAGVDRRTLLDSEEVNPTVVGTTPATATVAATTSAPARPHSSDSARIPVPASAPAPASAPTPATATSSATSTAAPADSTTPAPSPSPSPAPSPSPSPSTSSTDSVSGYDSSTTVASARDPGPIAPTDTVRGWGESKSGGFSGEDSSDGSGSVTHEAGAVPTTGHGSRTRGSSRSRGGTGSRGSGSRRSSRSHTDSDTPTVVDHGVPDDPTSLTPARNLVMKISFKRNDETSTYDHHEVRPGRPLYIGRRKAFDTRLFRDKAVLENANSYAPPNRELQALLSSKGPHGKFVFLEEGEHGAEKPGYYLIIFPKKGNRQPTNPLWRLVPGGTDWEQVPFTLLPIDIVSRERYCIGGQFHWKVVLDFPTSSSSDPATVADLSKPEMSTQFSPGPPEADSFEMSTPEY